MMPFRRLRTYRKLVLSIFHRGFKTSPHKKVTSGEVAVDKTQPRDESCCCCSRSHACPQLREAVEENNKSVLYNEQLEVYVQGILSRNAELEQQLNQAEQTLQQQHKGANSEGQSSASMQQEKQLQENQREIDEERKRARNLQAELKEMKSKYKKKSREVVRAQEELLEERRSGRQSLTEERKLNSKRVARLQSELEAADLRIDEERKLLLQIPLSARDFENEKLDRQSLQHQLHKVLKELRKARDRIARLESAKQQRETRFSEPSSYTSLDLDKMTSPLKSSSMLDEKSLECPNCRASYPVSQHRELLAHLDYCFN